MARLASKAERQRLWRQMCAAFDSEELRTLCHMVLKGADYDDLPGRARDGKVRELIARFENRGEVEVLLDACAAERPALVWDDFALVDNTAVLGVDLPDTLLPPRARLALGALALVVLALLAWRVWPRPTPPAPVVDLATFPGIPLTVVLPDGETVGIEVEPVLGSVSRLVELNQREGEQALPVEVVTELADGVPEPFPRAWYGYEVPHENQEPCPAWPNRFSIASLRYELAGGTVLVFAEKGGDYPARLLFPISGSGAVPLLDTLHRTDEPEFQGPLNASIQHFLASPGTTGQLVLYDGNSLSGNECVLEIEERTER